jgi:hypothetical protein
VLNEYGRELSSEVLSYAGYEGEGRFLYEAFKQPDWLLAGGDVRVLGLHRSGPPVDDRLILMQADLEAAIKFPGDRYVLVGTAGIRDSEILQPGESAFISRRHYMIVKMTPVAALRFGRFYPAFGLNVAEHTISTRRGLEWDQGAESYNTELSFLGETTNFYLTGTVGRLGLERDQREAGVAAMGSYFFGGHYKVGLSYFFGDTSERRRHVVGPWIAAAFSEKLVLLGEIDIQRTHANSFLEARWGFVDYLRLDWELVKGAHLFVAQERTKLNFSSSASRRDTYWVGVQLFPRAHFETQFVWQTTRLPASGGGDDTVSDGAFALLHFYP